ncbi:MAG TPA: glycosyltransferase family 39 protein [Candidatus Saccharimonadales bacterium]|nr:glycosyltransferase family 39 protein [Candidatus Saccharimonadales bacterium]
MNFLGIKISKTHLILVFILIFIFLLRLPSLYEPFWYGDEGIFGAVGRNLNLGGTLYQTAWDNKPPMIYLTYAAIFQLFGVSMFWLRLVTLVVVLSTACAIYEIARAILGGRRALVATFVFGVLTSLRLIEGNLSLTEIFMILPISLAMLVALKRNFDNLSLFVAGFLFALASLYKQVGAFEAAALGVYLFFISKSFLDFIKKGIFLASGFAVPYLATLGYFFHKHLVSDYIFAAYTYYRIYLSESPKYAQLITVLKFLPIIAAFFYAFFKRFGYRVWYVFSMKGEAIEPFHLLLLWCAFSFLGSYFSGRAYGHYLVQATPALSLLIASISLRVKLGREQVVFGVVFFGSLLFLTRLLFFDAFSSQGPINQLKYYKNFLTYARGLESVSANNDFFDRNVNTIAALSDFLDAEGARGKNVYIWGDVAWLYAISDLKNPSRYVTSFHVFGVPSGKEEVGANLSSNMPVFVIKMPSSVGTFGQLEDLLATKYTSMLSVDGAEIFKLK